MSKKTGKFRDIDTYCDGYMKYLGAAKTARRSYAESVKLLEANGFRELSKFKALKPGDAPKAVFAVEDDKPVAVYEHCNLHGLWKKYL